VQAVDDKVFTFDQVFKPDCTQEDVYSKVAQHAKAVIHGYNTTVFAYGSTGSGKSYTMTGTSAKPGIIPRVVSEIFSIIETTTSAEKDVLFYVRMSYVELYNNNFRNLLEGASRELNLNGADMKAMATHAKERSDRMNFSSGGHAHAHAPTEKIEVRESQAAGVFLSGHNLRIPITSAQEAFVLISKGNKLRATSYTNCNDLSSRSHAVLTIHVESRVFGRKDKGGDGAPAHSHGLNTTGGSAVSLASLDSDGFDTASSSAAGGELRLGKMHLVDLAGSERLAMSGAEGETLVETQNINLSLTALGDVLSALSKNATILAQQARAPGKSRSQSVSMNHTHMPVPYRNSKLTHLLKDSLGGNSKTIMITNVRCLSEYYQQTSISLLYASRAKKIQNKSSVNRNVIGDTGIHAVTGEIERLKKRLDDRTAEFDRLKTVQQMDKSENTTLKGKLTELNAANDQEKKQLEQQLSQIIHSQAGQLEVQKRKIVSLQDNLQQELAVSQNVIAEQDREIKWLKGALEDTSTEVKNQSTEQIQRMQRVVDAWQTQATNSQHDLAAATKKIEELRDKVGKLSAELSSVKETNGHLRAELQERNQEGSTLAETESKLRKELKLKSEVLAAVNAQNTDYVSRVASLTEAADRSTKSSTASANRIATLESELSVLRETYSRHQDESRRSVGDLERSRSELEEALSHRLQQAEEKVQIVSASSAQQVEQAEKQLQASQREFTRLKDQVAEIQTRTESIIRQKDAVISGLNGTNGALEAHVSEASARASALEVSNNALQSELGDIKLAAQDRDRDLLTKSETFLSQLELRANEVKQIHANYKQALDKQKAHYEQVLGDLKAAHQAEIARTHEDTKTELSHQLLATEELKVEAALRELQIEHDKRTRELQATLQETHEVQLAQELARQKGQLEESLAQETRGEVQHVEAEYKSAVAELHSQLEQEKARFAANTEALEQSRQRDIAELKAAHVASLELLRSELVVRHTEELRTLQTVLSQREEEHSDLLDKTTSESQAQVKTTVANYKAKYEKVYKAKLAEVEARHRDSCGELQTALEDTQARLQQELRLSLASQENKLREAHAQEMDALRQEGQWHEEQAQQRLQELERTHDQTLREKAASARESAVREQELLAAASEKELREEHRAALAKLERQLESESKDQLGVALAAQASNHAGELQQLRDSMAADANGSKREAVAVAEAELKRLQQTELDSQRQQLTAEAELKRLQQTELDSQRQQLTREWGAKLEECNSKWADICSQNVDAKAASLAVKASEEREAALEALRQELTAQFEDELIYGRQQAEAARENFDRQLVEAQAEHAQRAQLLVEEVRREGEVGRECAVKSETLALEEAHAGALKQLREELEASHAALLGRKAEEMCNLEEFVLQLRKKHEVALGERELEMESLQKDALVALQRQHRAEVERAAEEAERSMEGLRRECDLITSAMESAHEGVCAALKLEAASARAQSGSAAEQVEALREKSQFDAKLQQTKHEQQLQQLIDEKNAQYKTALRSANDVHSMEVQRLMVVQEKAEARHKAHSAQQERQHEQAVARLESDHRAALEEAERSLEARHAHQLASLTAAHKRSVEELSGDKESSELKLIRGIESKNAAVEEANEAVRALQEKLARSREEHADARERDAKTVDARMERSLRDMELKHEAQVQALTNSRDKLLRSHEDSIATIKAASAIEMEASSRRLLNDYQNKSLDEMRALTERSDARDRQNKDMLERVRGEMEVAEQRYRGRLQEATRQLQEAQELHTRNLAAAESKHEAATASMTAEFESKLNEMLGTQDSEHAEEVRKAQEGLQQERAEHQTRVAELNRAHQERVTELAQEARCEEARLKNQLSQQKVAQAEKELLHATEMEMLAESHEEATTKLHEQYQRNNEHSLEAQALKYAGEMEAELQQRQDELTERHAKDVERLTTEAREHREKLECRAGELETQLRHARDEHRREAEQLREEHSTEIARITQDSEAKIAQWKAMNHQLEQSMNSAGDHHRDLQADIEAMQHQHRQQVQNLTRTHESQAQAMQHAHEDALYQQRREAELAVREWREKEEAHVTKVAAVQDTLKARETDVSSLTNANLKLNNQVASMRAELETVSKDVEQMHRANVAKEEEFHGQVLPSMMEQERARVEAPLRQQADDLSRRLQEVTKLADEERGNAAEATAQLRVEVEQAQERLQALEEQREQASAEANRATQAALRQQHEDLQSGYLQVIQQQVESLMQVIVTNTEKNKLGNTKKGFSNSSLPARSQSNSGVDEMYQHFLDMVQTLPEVWKDKYGSFPSALSPDKDQDGGVGEGLGQSNPAYSTIRWHLDSLQQLRSNLRSGQTPEKMPRTPIKVLKKAEEARDQWILDQTQGAQFARGSRGVASSAKENVNLFSNLDSEGSARDSTGKAPTHSQKSLGASLVRTSPTDQLISAVLDGDSQGIRAVVKSSGSGSLTSDFWRNITASVLPLHRAISGLHFHGSESLLVSTLDTLLQLGADIQELDHSGNSAIHKAIQVCTSKSIVNVVKLLSDRGVNVNVRNKEGNTAMHCECKR